MTAPAPTPSEQREIDRFGVFAEEEARVERAAIVLERFLPMMHGVTRRNVAREAARAAIAALEPPR